MSAGGGGIQQFLGANFAGGGGQNQARMKRFGVLGAIQPTIAGEQQAGEGVPEGESALAGRGLSQLLGNFFQQQKAGRLQKGPQQPQNPFQRLRARQRRRPMGRGGGRSANI